MTTTESAQPIGSLVVREKSPPNLEMPFESVDAVITPNERFYVRCHFPVPAVDAAAWRLSVDGEVERPIVLDLEALRALPRHTAPATLECAGNGRVHLQLKTTSVLWDLGAVGHAEWTGVRLRDVLAQARVGKGALEVVLEGADSGQVSDPPHPATAIPYARSLPLEKALEDVLLAFEMNGEPLTAEHGAPVRAIVPGWYGMASVKWLQRIVVTREPFRGYFQTSQYAIWQHDEAGLLRQVPIAELQVKSQIASPGEGARVAAGSTVRVHGAAWTASGEITRVEVSDDEGATWHTATLCGDAQPNSWRLWELSWHVRETKGKCTLLARATDSLGNTQARQHDRNRGSYLISHCLPTVVHVG